MFASVSYTCAVTVSQVMKDPPTEMALSSLVSPVKLPLSPDPLPSLSQEQETGSLITANRQRKLLKTSPPLSHTNNTVAASSSSTTPGINVPESWIELGKILRDRKNLMGEICAMYKSNISNTVTSAQVSQIFVVDKYKLMYCEVPKAGCSNWKRTLMVLAGKAKNIEKINHDTAHYANNLLKLNYYDLQGIMHRLRTYTKVLFVREPMERMVSAYRDKLENPNSYYHNLFGKPIIRKYRQNPSEHALKTGDGVTFNEFVQYLLDVSRPVGMDIHWNPVNNLCHPCLVDYDFIGKFENMEDESNFLLRLIGAPNDLRMPTFKDRNPKDVKTSASITETYFQQVNLEQRQRVFDFYFRDYQMFNYSKPFKDIN